MELETKMANMITLLKTAEVRHAIDSYERDEISYSKMVEYLNEYANSNLDKHVNPKKYPSLELKRQELLSMQEFNISDCPYVINRFIEENKIDENMIICFSHDCRNVLMYYKI